MFCLPAPFFSPNSGVLGCVWINFHLGKWFRDCSWYVLNVWGRERGYPVTIRVRLGCLVERTVLCLINREAWSPDWFKPWPIIQGRASRTGTPSQGWQLVLCPHNCFTSSLWDMQICKWRSYTRPLENVLARGLCADLDPQKSEADLLLWLPGEHSGWFRSAESHLPGALISKSL